MYELKIEDAFASAHNLRGYQGACEELHGHNWKIEVIVRTDKLNDIGLAIDFKDLKQATSEVIDALDHKYLNELPPFKDENPSSENIARHIFREVGKRIAPTGVRVYKVTAWESEKACASYLEE